MFVLTLRVVSPWFGSLSLSNTRIMLFKCWFQFQNVDSEQNSMGVYGIWCIVLGDLKTTLRFRTVKILHKVSMFFFQSTNLDSSHWRSQGIVIKQNLFTNFANPSPLKMLIQKSVCCINSCENPKCMRNILGLKNGCPQGIKWLKAPGLCIHLRSWINEIYRVSQKAERWIFST